MRPEHVSQRGMNQVRCGMISLDVAPPLLLYAGTYGLRPKLGNRRSGLGDDIQRLGHVRPLLSDNIILSDTISTSR